MMNGKYYIGDSWRPLFVESLVLVIQLSKWHNLSNSNHNFLFKAYLRLMYRIEDRNRILESNSHSRSSIEENYEEDVSLSRWLENFRLAKCSEEHPR